MAEQIATPNQSALIDLLKEAFGVNLNRLKIDAIAPQHQSEIKQAILGWLEE